MISSIRGEVLDLALDHAIIDVSGFGLHVIATAQTLSGLRTGQEVRLMTSYVHRQDDAPLLFGFAHIQEREVFTSLLGISGIGPRLALAVLSVHTPEEVRQIIAESDTTALSKVPGIGKKTAQRIVLELAGKLVVNTDESGSAAEATATKSLGSIQDEVVAALKSLGWNEKDAAAAVDSTMAAEPELKQSEVAVVLKQTLRGLGRAK